MYNLLRGDFYRLAHERKPWVSLLVAGFVAVAQGGLIVPVILVLTALAVGEDFRSGFVKSILAASPRRSTYVIEKFLLVGLLDALVVVEALVIRLVAPSGGVTSSAFSTAPFLWLLVPWITMMACSSVVATVSFVTREWAAGIAIAILMSSSVAVDLVARGLAAISIKVPFLVRLSDWLVVPGMDLLDAGVPMTPGELAAAVVPAGVVIVISLMISVVATRYAEC